MKISQKVFLLLVFGLISIGLSAQTVLWTVQLNETMTFASPRTWDLTGDGVKDIVLADGVETESIGHVSAFDGVNGNLLWSVSRVGELFASPQFRKINGDELDDVIMAGRMQNLFCIDGPSGTLIWEFDTLQVSPTGHGWLQFYEPQSIADVTGDQLDDLVVINGGDPTAAPNQQERVPGVLLLLDASDGSVVHQALMPDSAESYSSLVLIEGSGPETTYIYFGSGGETVQGSVWRTTLDQLMNDDISGSLELVSGVNKGFIAPPVLADLTGDGTPDLIAAGMDGTLTLVNGLTSQVEWSFEDSELEIYAVPGIGDFNGDQQLDVLATFNHGAWPVYDFCVQAMFSGDDGAILRMDSVGLQITSPLVYDIDTDGSDEAIIPYSESYGFDGSGQAIIKLDEPGFQPICYTTNSVNIASTPCWDDLDDDGDLEIIEVHFVDTFTVALQVWETEIVTSTPLRWTAYHGTYHNGIYYTELPLEVVGPTLEEQLTYEVVYTNQGMQVVLKDVAKDVKLFDLLGKQHDLRQVSSFTYSLLPNAPGIYFLSYQFESKIKTIKLFLQ